MVKLAGLPRQAVSYPLRAKSSHACMLRMHVHTCTCTCTCCVQLRMWHVTNRSY